jgi:5-(carboxyamino)imidazole ribonucleotide synthase
MLNILGDLWTPDPPAWDRVLAYPNAKLHLYGKTIPKGGRKMGHVTVVASTASEAREQIEALRRTLIDG